MDFNQDKLIEMVDDFLKPFGCTSDFDSDFQYDPTDNTVYFTIIYSERSDRLFKQYIENKFDFTIPNLFTISLLHEVGHSFTLFDFSEKEMKRMKKEKKAIEKALEKNDTDEKYSEYFDLPVEKVATAWAINYYRMNKKRCDDFYQNVCNFLMSEYERLEVTE